MQVTKNYSKKGRNFLKLGENATINNQVRKSNSDYRDVGKNTSGAQFNPFTS